MIWKIWPNNPNIQNFSFTVDIQNRNEDLQLEMCVVCFNNSNQILFGLMPQLHKMESLARVVNFNSCIVNGKEKSKIQIQKIYVCMKKKIYRKQNF